MPPKAVPKTIPSVDPVAESNIKEKNLELEMNRKKSKVDSFTSSLRAQEKLLNEMKEDRAQVLKDKEDVINDITREFKVQQNDYRKKISELNQEVEDLERQLAETQMKIRHTRDKFERQRTQKDETIHNNIIKSEQMAQEFRDMLKGTLVKMSDKLETSRESDENQPIGEQSITSDIHVDNDKTSGAND